MEEKIPHIVYTKWEEEKDRLKEEGEEITIDGFIKFYTGLINIEEKAQYVRKQSRPDDRGQQMRGQARLNLHHANIRPYNQTNRNTDPGKYKQAGENIRANFKGKIQGNIKRNYDKTNNTPPGATPAARYCIFCETNTHDTTFCRIARFTADYKTQQCQKHNACYMCFKTSEHKASTCPKTIKCRLCPRLHHFNNHTRKEIDDYYKKRKKNPNTK